MREHANTLVFYLIGALALRALQTLLGDDGAVWAIIVTVPAAYGVAGLFRRAQTLLDRRRATQILRQMPAARRLEVLETLDAESRVILQNGLALDGTESEEGIVERFPFPLRRTRFVDRLLSATLFTGVIALILVGFTQIGSLVAKWSLTALGVTAVPLAIVLRRLHWRLSTVIEVSPFQIVEIAADGRRTSIPFAQSLVLVNEPRWRRMQIGPSSLALRINLHYSRMGFSRLIDRVIEYGGFREVV